MSAFARRFVAARASVLVLALGKLASAFCRTTVCSNCELDPVTNCATGTPVAWPQLCVSWSMQYQASQQVGLELATEVAKAAFDNWQSVSCPGGGHPSIQVDNHFGPVACNVHEYNQADGNANIVLFHDDKWPYDVQAIALTTVTFSRKTGDIYDVDMEINGTQPLSATDQVDPSSYDLQSIIAHESGHFLGLAHSLNPEATMWATYSPGADSFRTLSDDDIAGICTVYPPTDAPSTCDYTPRQGFSPECGLYPAGVGTCSVSSGAFARTRPRTRGVPLVALAVACAVLARRRGKLGVRLEDDGSSAARDAKG